MVIGGVGSGKSTFTDYLKEVALPNDIKEKTFWMTLNMNDAPSSKEVIYDWLLNYAIDYIKIKIPEYDTNDYSFISKIFAKQIKEFEKGPIVLLKDNQERYSIELYNFIMFLVNDKSLLFKAITDYLFSNRSKSLIIVLDNVDKRSRDTQLLMFEVSNWLKSTFNCTVFLPLREVTFDHYRKEPPLDTVIKDLVFRIEPPLLEQVIYARFKYALRQIESDHSSFYYYLRNGARVECKRDQVKHYLSSILKTLFQNNFFRRLISGLSERDIRRGLEIFLDFCKSGYIEEDNILKMRINGSTYDLPNHLVTRILLRGDRRYYSDN